MYIFKIKIPSIFFVIMENESFGQKNLLDIHSFSNWIEKNPYHDTT